MRRRLAAAIAIGLAASLAGPASAGSVEGPYLVWINLGTHQPAEADAQIRAFVDGSDHLCWPNGALLYMRKRPPALTPALARRAVLGRDAAAVRQVQAILRRPFDEVAGFDGVVVYTDAGPPRLASLAVGGRKKSEAVRGPTGEAAWGATFCNVMPPIARLP